jgi:hypothetical protein
MSLETKVTGLVISELGAKRSEDVMESISKAKMSYSANGSSQFDFTVQDPNLIMNNNGYFMIRRLIEYDETKWEIAAVNVNAEKPDSVDVTCRTEGIQKLKRDKGGKNFGKISPTSFAAQMAAKYGLEFYGERSTAKEAITRTQNERTDESSWDVLRRLASDLEFELFEADGILYFASRKNLIANQPLTRVWWPPGNVPSGFKETMPVRNLRLRRSDNDPLGGTLNANVDRTNGIQLRPGMAISVGGIAFFENWFMVDQVDWDIGEKTDVKITGATLDDNEDTGCETRTFKRGDTSGCVLRIQLALGVTLDRVFGPETEKAVIAFQSEQGLEPNGIVDPKTWAKIRATR